MALQLHEVIEECQNEKELIQQLSSLPKDLDAAYDRIFERSKRPGDLLKILQWLAFSKRDMTVAEIAEVGTVDLASAEGPIYDPKIRNKQPAFVLNIGYGLVTVIDGEAVYL